MRKKLAWGWRCVGGLAMLLLLSHCGDTRGELPTSRGAEQQEPSAADCRPAGEGTSSYCTYRGTGGGRSGWVRHYGGLGSDRVDAMASGAGGGFAVAGRFGDEPLPEGRGFALARYDANGTPLWSRRATTGYAQVTALAVTPLGNLLVAGTYYGAMDLGTGPLPEAPGSPSSYQGLFLAKFAPDGRPVWSQGFVATHTRDGQLDHWPIIPRAVTTDEQGSLIVTGDFHGEMNLGGGPLFAGEASVWPRFETYSGGFLARFSWSGEHLWSRAFKSHITTRVPITSASVATDSAGNLWVGGFAGLETDLGDGQLGSAGPFIARYDSAGTLLWKRLFPGIYGEVAGLRPLGAEGVAFLADFAGSFTFAGQSYTAGDISAPGGAYDTRPFFGTLSTTQGDGWLRALGDGSAVWELSTEGEKTLTVTGSGAALDLGGGVLGPNNTPRPFVARYKASGEHLWSRSLDGQVNGHFIPSWGTSKVLGYLLVPQPCGALVLGSDFSSSVEIDGTVYRSNGNNDLLYHQLLP